MQLTLVLLECTALAFLEAGVPVHAFGTVAANRPSVLGIIAIAGFNKQVDDCGDAASMLFALDPLVV